MRIVGKTRQGINAFLLSADQKRVARYSFAAAAGVPKLSAWLDGQGGGVGDGTVRGVIYDSGGNLIAQGSDVTIRNGADGAWVDLPFPDVGGTQLLLPGLYDLGLHTGPNTNVIRAYGDGIGSDVLTTTGPLTESGNEITDSLRALATSGDGRGYVPVTNLLPNGGAEVNTTNIATNGFGPGAVGTTSRITSDSKFGSACIEIVVTTFPASGSWAFVWYSGLGLFQPGETYTVSAWVKHISGSNQWKWHIGDTTSTNIVMPMSSLPPLKTGTWMKVSRTFTANQAGNLPGVFMTPFASGAAGTSTIRIDGVQVEVGPQPHDYVDTQNNAPQRNVQRDVVRNLMLNPDFEVDTSWWVSWGGTGPATLALATGPVFEGLQSLSLTNGGAGANTYGATLASQPVAGGTTYTASAWVYSTAARSFVLNMLSRDFSNVAIGASVSSVGQAVPLNTWTRITFTFTTPVNTEFADFSVGALNAAAGEVFYLDAVQLEVGAAATAYMPAPVLVPLDQTTGVWEGTTNLINGDFEANATGWLGASSPAALSDVARDLNVSKFGAASLRGFGIPGQAATVAGTPITDVMRAANVEGDGRGYQYVRNECPNGSFETASTGWGLFGTGSTVARDSTRAKVGTWALKVTTPGLTVAGGGEGCSGPSSAVGTAAQGQTWTGSVWVWSAAGGEQVVWGLDERDSSGAFLAAATSNYTLVAGWQKLTNVRTLINANVNRVGCYFRTQGVAQAITVWLDSVQVELGAISHDTVETTTVAVGAIQGPLVTNYVSNGSFEYGTAGWANFVGGTIARSTAQLQIGVASGAITVAAANDGASTQIANLRSDTSYVASTWIKGTNGRSYKLVLTGLGTGTVRGSTTVVANGAWQRIAVLGTPSVAEAGLNVLLQAVAAGADTFFIDGVQLEESGANINAHPSVVETNASAVSSAVGLPDSSFGIHEGTTNLLVNGGAETGLANQTSAGLNTAGAWPSTPVIGAGTGLTGTFIYKASVYVTNVNGTFESNAPTASGSVVAANNDIVVTLPPVQNGDATGRKLYRSSDGGTTWKFVATIVGIGVGATFTDSTPDASLTTLAPPSGTGLAFGQALVSRVLTGARFGSACFQVQTPGAVAAEGMVLTTATGLARAAATPVTGSVWIKGTPGVKIAVWMRVGNTDTSISDSGQTAYTLNGDWQRIQTVAWAVQAGKTGDNYQLMIRTSAVFQQTVFFTDGGQVEEKPYVTPYVHTNGAAASRTAARYSTSYSTYLANSTGSITFRVRMGFSSTEMANRAAVASTRLLDWSTDTNNRILVVIGSDLVWRTFRQSGGLGGSVASAAQTFNAGDYMTITARWDATNIYITVNGVTTSAGNTTIPSLPSTVDFGSNGAASGYFDGDILWALPGKSVLSAGDLTTLNTIGIGWTDPVVSPLAGYLPVPLLPSTAFISALFPFTTTAFSDFVNSFPNIRTLPFAATAGTSYSFSAWVLCQPGQTLTLKLFRADFSTLIGSMTVTATGGWQRLTASGVAPATENIYGFVQVPGYTNGGAVWIDGAQLEAKPVATPFTPTTRAAARVQAPSSLLNQSQGWVAIRMRMGFAASAIANSSPAIFEWGDGGFTNRIAAYFQNNLVQLVRQPTLTGAQVSANTTFAAGDTITVVAKWTPTQLGLSVNGAAFNLAGNTSSYNIAAALFDIASLSPDSIGRQLDADILWFASGTGVPADADAVTINGFGDAVPSFSAIPAAPTFIWPGAGSTYIYTQNGMMNTDTFSDGASAAFGAALPLDFDMSVFATTIAPSPSFVVPDESDDYFSRLPFLDSQRALTVNTGTLSVFQGTCGWHGTRVSGDRGAFAVARTGGKFDGLVGERVRLSPRDDPTRYVVVYVNDESSDLEDDLSVTRRMFAEIGQLSTDALDVKVEVLA